VFLSGGGHGGDRVRSRGASLVPAWRAAPARKFLRDDAVGPLLGGLPVEFIT
jgi:hypothetical protein